MANFTCDPAPYIPLGAVVQDAWQRPARSRVAIGGEPPRRHEEYAIVSMDPLPPPAIARAALTNACNFVEAHYPVRIESSFLSPLGLGLLEFGSSVMRQSMLDLSPIPYDGNAVLRFCKHDEAQNLRSCAYTRECWIMFLAFPLDYQSTEFFDAAIAPFGRRLYWHKGPNKSRSLIKCLILAPERVPRSVVISRGTPMGGNGRSWSSPTFILGGQFADQLIAEEDPIPPDANPHPPFGQPLQGNPDVFQNWMHDVAGAGAQVLGDVGINVQQMQDINMELNIHNNNAADAAPDQADGLVVHLNADDLEAVQDEIDENEVPHHPDQPQDTISFNLSGSTANYLRANGPDIHLTVEQVEAGIQNSSSSDSSGVVVTSTRIMHVTVPEFVISACHKMSMDCIFDSVTLKPTSSAWKEDVKSAIVPVTPSLDALLLKCSFCKPTSPVGSQGQLLGNRHMPKTLPSAVSRRGSRTPLVDTMVRRSPRLNPDAIHGTSIVKAKEPASKRRKLYATLNLNSPATTAEAMNPIPISTLQDWARACGVAPGELSEEGRDDDQV